LERLVQLFDHIRRDAGFRTAKDFHSFLRNRGLNGNYQHFMKIYKGEFSVSPDFIAQMGAILPKWQDTLTLTYCQCLFPKQEYLFAGDDLGSAYQQASPVAIASDSFSLSPKSHSESNSESNSESHSRAHSKRQSTGHPDAHPAARELTIRQVQALASCKEVYFIFLLATLSRRPFRRSELAQYFSEELLSEALELLATEKILLPVHAAVGAIKDNTQASTKDAAFEAFSTEIKFPAVTPELRKLYDRLDLWDKDFAHEMELSAIVERRLLRRISGRYLQLILQHVELILQTARCADELETRYNSEVIQLAIEVRKGRLPG
jgi:hypothetical protein